MSNRKDYYSLSTAIISTVIVSPDRATPWTINFDAAGGRVSSKILNRVLSTHRAASCIAHVVRGLYQVTHIAASFCQDFLQLFRRDILPAAHRGSGTRAYKPEM